MADFDLNEALNSLLSDPETGNKLSSLMASLSSGGKSEDVKPEGETEAFPDIGSILKIKELYDSALKENDPNIVLLSSLKPYLSETRNKNLDSMMKMLKIYKVFLKVKDTPLLKELF
ncbi:MAG: hypothetical protein IKL74_05415 [Clostridia bacterium]|nr:hypothetical protein [Clostridia bacterium]